LTTGQARSSWPRQLLSSIIVAKAKTFVRLSRLSGSDRQAVSERGNPNVWNILPVTTFRTIDLEGKKNPGPLFSGF
jgi:hypothetical protein